MAVKIRLRRVGANNAISFRIVVTDSRSPRDGKNIETLGWYDPKRAGKNCELDAERIKYWIGKGAAASDTVASLVKKSLAKAKQGA
jgi:small subunit ribosomal protein S16